MGDQGVTVWRIRGTGWKIMGDRVRDQGVTGWGSGSNRVEDQGVSGGPGSDRVGNQGVTEWRIRE